MSTAAKEITIVPQQSTALTPMDMLNQAVERGANIDVLEKLMALQERWESNQARKAFDEAVADAKAEIPPIIKNRDGHNTRYADFAAIARTVDPIISKHGLSYRFRTSQDDRIHVTCVLSHRAGHSEETTLGGPADTSGNKNAIQAIGSTLTYLQRYSLLQALGIAVASDDDGAASGGSEKITQEQVERLQTAIVEAGADIQRFLKYFKIEDISDLPASKLKGAYQMLEAKMANEAKRGA